MTGLPSHLRDDAPDQVCDRCGRHTFATAEFGAVCKMPQQWSPEGGWYGPCGGTFRPPAELSEARSIEQRGADQ